MAFLEVGSIRLGQDRTDDNGNFQKGKLYLKLHQVTDKQGKYTSKNLRELADALEKNGSDGVNLQIEKQQEEVKRLASLGYIDDDKLESRLESIPDWLKYKVTLVTKK